MMVRVSTKIDKTDTVTLHASCIAFNGRGLLLVGDSGSGKSALALQLMAWGADLVADDQTILTPNNGFLYARAPEGIRGLIEARGVGLLKAQTVSDVRIDLLVDLDQLERKRLPELKTTLLAGVELNCLHKVDSSHFPAALLQYLKFGREHP